MTNYEFISILISGIAALIAILSLRGQRKLQTENNQLQKVTAELAKKQLDQIKVSEDEHKKARLVVGLYNERPTPKFYIINSGTTLARNIDFKLVLDEEKLSPLIQSEVDEALPIPFLDYGDKATLIAAITDENPIAYSGVLSWTNPDGTIENKEFHARLH